MLKAKDLRGESSDELQAMVKDLDAEIFRITNELKVHRKLEKPHLLRQKRKDRARVLTILREKELQG